MLVPLPRLVLSGAGTGALVGNKLPYPSLKLIKAATPGLYGLHPRPQKLRQVILEEKHLLVRLVKSRLNLRAKMIGACGPLVAL